MPRKGGWARRKAVAEVKRDGKRGEGCEGTRPSIIPEPNHNPPRPTPPPKSNDFAPAPMPPSAPPLVPFTTLCLVPLPRWLCAATRARLEDGMGHVHVRVHVRGEGRVRTRPAPVTAPVALVAKPSAITRGFDWLGSISAVACRCSVTQAAPSAEAVEGNEWAKQAF